MTDLYTNLTLSLLSRYSSVRYTSYDELSDSVADNFWDLAELAYRHLLNFEFVFSNVPDDLIELGFLQSFPRMYSHKDASSCHSFLHSPSFISFIHFFTMSLTCRLLGSRLIVNKWVLYSLQASMHCSH